MSHKETIPPHDEDWTGFAEEVDQLYKQAAELRDTFQMFSKLMPSQEGYGYIYWHPKEQMAWAVIGPKATEQMEQKWHIGLQALRLKGGFRIEKEQHPPGPKEWIRVKQAAVLGIVHDKFASLESRTPLANSIVGGLLGAGGGYVAGSFLEDLLPEEIFDRRNSNLRRFGAIAGGLAGAVPGAIQNFGHAGTAAQLGKTLPTWTTPTNAMPNAATDPKLEAQQQLFESTKAPHPWTLKAAEMYGNTGVDDVASVPKDAFNRVIWNDVSLGMSARKNPYGTKDPFGDDGQPMHTPPAVGAAMTGLVSGVARKYDTSIVTPGQIVSGLVGAGVGGVTARVVARTLGTLAGLKPEAQGELQRMGVWGGLMTGLARQLFSDQ